MCHAVAASVPTGYAGAAGDVGHAALGARAAAPVWPLGAAAGERRTRRAAPRRATVSGGEWDGQQPAPANLPGWPQPSAVVVPIA